ncbi:MAG: nucleotidyltransferase domain-containing protein [Bacteroidales bacterium]|nr:nucleotidyltransferase domain-containing protein [Bacteroidales bacterium]
MDRNQIIMHLSDMAKLLAPKGTSVWLYGSQARGNACEESDWDILILLDKSRIEKNDFDTISYPMIEWGWAQGADFSPQLYTKQEWQSMRITPYAQNVERDKMVIYES